MAVFRLTIRCGRLRFERMFGKIFEQIFDSSVAEDWTVRVVFQDLIVLANMDGVVDRTPESIARRTNVPLEIVLKAIALLEQPDPRSRSKEENGARIRRLDDHRDWGWEIINYEKYRVIASEEQRREKTKLRTRKWRDEKDLIYSVTHGDAPVTPRDAGDAMEREKQKEKEREKQKEEEREGARSFSETPSWREFFSYCQIHGGPVEWYARDKFQAAEQDNWKGKSNWTAYADRVRTWWINDGRPMAPVTKNGEHKSKRRDIAI